MIEDHSYTVIYLKVVNNKKLLMCKNPWGHTIPFKTARLQEDPDSLLNNEIYFNDEDQGLFWIEWEKALELFSYIYLAWNPDIYPFKYKFTSNFTNKTFLNKNSHFYDQNFNLEYNPQYIITIPPHSEDFEVRIIISKHVNKLEAKSSNSNKISYKLFNYEGYMIIYPLDHLRTLTDCKMDVTSDVFIFEATEQEEQYVFVLLDYENTYSITNQINASEESFYTMEVTIKFYYKNIDLFLFRYQD